MNDSIMASRRKFLRLSAGVGCSLAAHPLLTPVTLAAAPSDKRLIVILLRGAMDGLDIVQPYGDPALAGLRRSLLFGRAGGGQDLDGFFALHPGLTTLMPLWQAGEMGFVHAVSTPYRDKRSHFDGQDILEAGTAGTPPRERVGWLNRMLQTVPGLVAETTYAVGLESMMLTAGPAPVASWSPEVNIGLSTQTQRLLDRLYAHDPLFHAAYGSALATTDDLEPNYFEQTGEMLKGMMGGGGQYRAHQRIAEFVAARMREETRIAAFSISGWDTHSRQSRALKRPLSRLSETLLTLRDGLGTDWQNTAILAMTEFGRTARENGTDGTDHGTGSAMLLAGGAVHGGKVHGRWPGLGEGNLYRDRDLLPTGDVRAQAAWVMRGLFGTKQHDLEQSIFPGLDMGSDPRLLRA